MKKALIVYGGWDGHEPDKVAAVTEKALKGENFDVELSETLDAFNDEERLLGFDLIVPCWTMGKLEGNQAKGLCGAVRQGVGIAGFHGGMGDAFRENTGFQRMVGGQFVSHPKQFEYRVYITDHMDPITAGIDHFNIFSEQYYMHVDPSNRVLAVTVIEENGCIMPVIWKRLYGKGRVFYSALGHAAKDFEIPEVLATATRGMLWAAERSA